MQDEAYCYLTTPGRKTGKPHTVEIWFGLSGSTLYMLAGGGEGADWVKNARRQPAVTIRIRAVTFVGHVRSVQDSDDAAMARRILVEKYQPASSDDLGNWGRTALPIAVELARK
ncbi:MAG: nitroreductase family deazaflavin-dependent oxidoreductase [Dehalococcoidia bacterium]